MRHSVLPLLLASLVQLLVLLPVVVTSSRGIAFDASMQVFLAADERTSSSLDKLETVLANEHAVMISMALENLFSDEGAALLGEMTAAVDAVPGIERALSLTRAERPVKRGLSLGFEPFLPLASRTPEDWERIRRSVTEYPWARDLLVSRDGRAAMIVAEIETPLVDHADRVRLRTDLLAALAPYRARVDALHVGAFPFVEAEIQEGVEADLLRFLAVLPVLLAVILLVTFRSWLVLGCVLVLQATGLGLLPILFRWDGSSVNLYTAILFPLMAGLQLTLLTHLLSALQWSLRRGALFADALRAALGQVLGPSLIAAVTTIIGLLSLTVCDVDLVVAFGRLGAQAVGLVFVVTFLPPVVLVRILGGAHPGRAVPADPIAVTRTGWLARIEPVVDVLHRRRYLVIAAATLACLAALPALGGVRTDLRAIEFLAPSSPSRQALSFVDDRLGGMNVFELELDTGRPGGIQQRPVLEYLEGVRTFGERLPGVTSLYTYSQIYTVVNRLWNEDAPDSDRLPPGDFMLKLVAGLVHGADFHFSEAIYDEALQRTTIFLRTRDMPAESYLALLEDLLGYAEDTCPPGMTVQARAGIHTVLDSDREVVASQLESLLACVLAVLVTLGILWRSARLALLALLCNVPALAAVLMLLGYGDAPLNSITVMVSAVVLGIAVDDAIHLLSFWKSEQGAFADPRAAMAYVLAHKAKPMICTSAVLVAGLGLFLGASFPPVADFGRLSVAALVVSLASVLFVLPALVFVAPRRVAATESRAAGTQGGSAPGGSG